MFKKQPLVAAEESRQSARFVNVLTPERTLLLNAETKNDVLVEMADALATAPEISDRAELLTALRVREELMSTGIGLHVAVPHVRLKSVSDLVLSVGLAPHGVDDYESIDGLPVYAVFAMAAGSSQHTEYIQMLSLVSRVMKDSDKRRRILSASTARELYERILESEDEL